MHTIHPDMSYEHQPEERRRTLHTPFTSQHALVVKVKVKVEDMDVSSEQQPH